jgi:hypothetical protein
MALCRRKDRERVEVGLLGQLVIYEYERNCMDGICGSLLLLLLYEFLLERFWFVVSKRQVLGRIALSLTLCNEERVAAFRENDVSCEDTNRRRHQFRDC